MKGFRAFEGTAGDLTAFLQARPDGALEVRHFIPDSQAADHPGGVHAGTKQFVYAQRHAVNADGIVPAKKTGQFHLALQANAHHFFHFQIQTLHSILGFEIPCVKIAGHPNSDDLP
ncbi:hypothetical protein SDC9_147990 [bioreactor metagenome]|uniref:Uncharacterized protein n=1 Tax=bioreactor metagenome TaxID=1076179 RepID=A0A645EHP8_9ZZZZ